MHTLSELETVVDRLPLAEQEELLRHLEQSLRRRRTAGGSGLRDAWMSRLDELRASIGSGTPGVSGEQILDELREE